jgi:MFS family permease
VTRLRDRGTLVALAVLLTCNHTVLAGSRVAVSLDALNRGLSPAGVGILIAMFGLLPMLCAMHAGRLVDRVGVVRPMMVGTLFTAGGVLLPFLLPGLAALYIAAPLMGFGFMVFQVAVQRATGDVGRVEDRAANFGLLGLASSTANFAGPLIAGLSIDALGHRAAFGALGILPLVPLLALVSRRLSLPAARPAAAAGGRRGLLDLLTHPRLRRLFVVNGFVSVGWDIQTVFVPIYGSELGLSSAKIGLILSSFAAASFVVRFAIRWIARRWTEQRILAWALLTAGIVYFLLPMTREVGTLVALSFLLGLGLGTGQPMVMSLLHAHAPQGRMGEAAGLRISLIQSMAVAVPLVFGAVGSSFGLLAVFWAAGLCVGAGGIAVQRYRE